MKIFIPILFSILVIQSVNAQPWLKFLPKQKVNKQTVGFYEIQDAFNQYWKNRDIKDKYVTKGKGYKPFKRWEQYMIPRVYPYGIFPADQTWIEFKKERVNNRLKTLTSANWRLTGPSTIPVNTNGKPSGLGRINCVAFHPANQNIIYTGSPSGGFWKSTNGGTTWFTTTDELPSIGISDIVINPGNPDIIYIATGDGDANDTYSVGVLKSIDGGISWNTTGLNWTTNNKITIRKLIINPVNPNILLAATSIGIYKSEDGGNNWGAAPIINGNFKDIEFHPTNYNIIYAARYGTNNSRFYKSANGGNSFVEISTGVTLSETYRLELATSISNPDIIYALYSEADKDGFHSLWKSTNAGSSWTKMYDAASGMNILGWMSDGSDKGGQGWYDLSLAISPMNSDEVYVGGVNIWKSNNSGHNWELVGDWEGNAAPYVHADHHYLGYSPTGILFNGNDGGIYKTDNGGNSWTDISNDLPILQIDRMGISQINDYITVVGNQDNGTMKYDGESDSWIQVLGGDGGDCFVDNKDNNYVYISYVGGELKRSITGGTDFISIKPEYAGNGAWLTPFIMSPSDNKTLYAGYHDVWKSTDRGESWTKISDNLSPSQYLSQIAVAPSNTDYIYVSSGYNLWITKDGGISWNEITNSELSGLFYTYFAIDDVNPDRIWLTVSGFNNGKKVFFSEDAGETWLNISENLPNVPVNCIVRENQSNDVLYVGTDIGVYYRDLTMTNWEVFSTGLPNVEISELEIQYSSSVLRAATRGRGLWETPILLSGTVQALYYQCFEGGTIPVGWTVEPVIDPGGIPAQIDFITFSNHPGGFSSKTCSNFVRFNSHSCESGDRVRLKMSSPISAVSSDSLRLSYYFVKDNEFSANNDMIISEWSADGINWNKFDTISRYTANIDTWQRINQILPDEAENQDNLYISFLFVSAKGNDLHIDDVKIEKIKPCPPLLANAITNEKGTLIELSFNKDMMNPAGEQGNFKVNNGIEFSPTSIYHKEGFKDIYIMELPVTLAVSQTIKISYTGTSIESFDKAKLADFSDKIVKNNVSFSLNNLDESKNIRVFPNPNSGYFDIEWHDLKSKFLAIRIINTKGQSLYYHKFDDILSEYCYSVNAKGLENGIYYLLIETQTGKYQKAVVIE